jgi:hypothetical protein
LTGFFKLPVKERVSFARLLAERLEFLFSLLKVGVDFWPMGEVESNGAINAL